MHLIGRLLDVANSASSSPPPGSLHVVRQDSANRRLPISHSVSIKCKSYEFCRLEGNPLFTRGAIVGPGMLTNGGAFQSPHAILRPMGIRRAPGLAITGRSDTPVRPRSSSAHPVVQRAESKEAIPLAELSASAEHSLNDNQVNGLIELFSGY